MGTFWLHWGNRQILKLAFAYCAPALDFRVWCTAYDASPMSRSRLFGYIRWHSTPEFWKFSQYSFQ